MLHVCCLSVLYFGCLYPISLMLMYFWILLQIALYGELYVSDTPNLIG
jgi:hypothetical protein